MSYTITKTDGTLLTTVADGTIDSTSSDLILIGKNYTGYGQAFNTDVIKLLENFSANTAPTLAMEGQIWWNKGSKTLSIRSNSAWKSIGSITANTAAPTNPAPVAGDQWYDTTNKQLKTYDGSGWTLVGPTYNATQNVTGAFADTVTDNVAASHTVIKFISGNVIMGIWSKDASFTPSPALTGFATISTGLNLTSNSGNLFVGTATNSSLLNNLASTQFLRRDTNDTTSGTIGIVNNSGLQVGANTNAQIVTAANNKASFQNTTSGANLAIAANVSGTMTDIIFIDTASSKASIVSANVTATTSSTSTSTGALVVAGGAGVAGNVTANNFVATNFANVLAMTATGNINANNITLTNFANAASMTVTANSNANNFVATNIVSAPTHSGATHTNAGALTISTTAAGNISLSPNAGSNVQVTANANITSTTSSTATTAGALVVAGGAGIAGNINVGGTRSQFSGNVFPSANVTYDLGGTSNWWKNIYGNTIFGTSSGALYADLAEKYTADAVYEPGTVLVFGGTEEVTISDRSADTRVAGVVSTAPAYLMNMGSSGTAIALRGKVPVKIIGPVSKGDLLVTSETAGYGMSVGNETPSPHAVFGKSLETNLTEGPKVINAVVV